MKIGLISDTHGLLRPEAVQALEGVQRIIHAGDICGPEVLRELEKIAPVDAVRGNNDQGAWAEELPEVLDLEFEGVPIRVIHDLKELDKQTPAGRGARATRRPRSRESQKLPERQAPSRGAGPHQDDSAQTSGAAGLRVVICGHSHKPVIAERDGVLFVNPGSAGPRRFSLPVAVGYLLVTRGTARAQIMHIL